MQFTINLREYPADSLSSSPHLPYKTTGMIYDYIVIGSGFGGLGPMRKKCIECGGCMVGCREKAKNTLDMNYLWFAEKMGLEILPETRAEKITFTDNLYHIETKNITSLFPGKRKIFTARGIVVATSALGTLNLLLKQKYRYNTLPLLSDSLGFQLRTNSETLCAVSGAREKLNNGLAITSVFSPDETTNVEIVKYPDGSNAIKWFFGLAVGAAPTSLIRTWKLIKKTVTHPLLFLKTVFNFKWSTNMVIFLVMQTVDNAMKMIWKKNIFGGRMKIVNHGQKKVPAFIPVGCPCLTITSVAEYAMSRIPVKEGSGQTELSKQLLLLEEEWKKKKSV